MYFEFKQGKFPLLKNPRSKVSSAKSQTKKKILLNEMELYPGNLDLGN
jgi:hypothetical protein